jgi:hypothetical protein
VPRQLAARFDGEVAGAVADSFFVNCRIGVPMAMTPVERSQLRGHRQQIGKSAALTEGALALDRSAPPRH